MLIAPYEVQGIENTTMSVVLSWVESKQLITLDIETTPMEEFRYYKKAGLDPYTSNIVMLQIGDDQTQFAIDTRFTAHGDILYLLNKLKTKKIVGQNLKFDWKMIYHKYGIVLNNLADTMVSEMILECGRQDWGFSLAALSKKYLGFKYSQTNQLDLFGDNSNVGGLSKDTRTTFAFVKENPFSYEQVYYGLMDIKHTHLIYREQLFRILEDNLWKTAYLEYEYIKVLAWTELNGFYFDSELWMEEYEANNAHLDELYNEILQIILEEEVEIFYQFQLSLFPSESVKDKVDINLASSQQVILLCKSLGIPTEVLDKKASKEAETDIWKDTVEEKHLKKYKNKHRIIPVYLEYRKYLKACSTYGENFLDHKNPVTGRAHSSYWQILDTGRISSREPNLQNITARNFPNLRRAFRATDGRCLIVTDYSAQESRVMADFAKEDKLIDFFNSEDPDFHSFTARNMWHVDVYQDEEDEHGNITKPGKNKHLRQRAKVLNFGIPFGMGEHKLATDFDVANEEAKAFIDNWLNTYPKLKKFFAKQERFILKNGYVIVDPFTLRKSYSKKYDEYLESQQVIQMLQAQNKRVPKKLWSKFFSAKGNMERKAKNCPIQGGAAGMTKLAGVLFFHRVKARDLLRQISLVNKIHDEIVVDTFLHLKDLAATLISESMVDAGKVFCRSIPMVANPVITDHWTH